ncbi:MAG TPA: hypothetical protein VHO24_16620 [Opitutaceae bacterium]|nr:hypothetical protein [Opitutaceae bacterium]
MPDAPESAISTSLRLTKALGLARQGKLQPAEQLLAPQNTIPSSAVELHALAALVTHQGDYERALRLWRLLLQKQPGHPEARRMIPMIELWVGRPAWHRFVPLGAGVLASLVVGVVLLWAFGAFSSPAPAKTATPPPSATPSPTVTPAPATPAPTPAPIRVAPPKKQGTR